MTQVACPDAPTAIAPDSEGRLHPFSRVLAAPRTLVCGIVNVTPDSFSDGGLFLRPDRAVEHGCQLADEGADVIDVGGESTRPGARPPTVDEEIDRVVPVIEALARRVAVPLSVDTSRPEVMRAAVAAGASMINDVRALRRPGALHAVANLGVPVCLMHMQREPRSMQRDPHYRDVVGQVRGFLAERLRACRNAGIPRRHLVIDPGFGFGKTLDHNLALLASLNEFSTLGAPIMVGLSRKSMLGELTGRGVGQRLAGSLAAAVVAAQRGASLLRVHDVAATRDALAVVEAVRAGWRDAPENHSPSRRAVAALAMPRAPGSSPTVEATSAPS
jgi:dihydropteroate synthase